MATNTVIINNVTYTDVSEINIPKSPSGTAAFYDVSDATIDSGGKLPDGVTAYGAGGVKYTGTAAENDSSDLTISGATVTVPAGYYASSASGTVSSGSATPASTISATGASVSTGTNTLTLSKSVSNTPTVSAGYISSGTAGSSSVSLTSSVTTKGATTYTPTTSDQTIASGTYLTGAQTVKGDSNLQSQYIKSGISIFGVAGSMTAATVSQDQQTMVLSIS